MNNISDENGNILATAWKKGSSNVQTMQEAC